MNIKNRIKSLRLNKFLTQKELGKLINVSPVSIGCWESGTKKPSIEALIAMAKVFNVSSDYLLGINEDATSEIVFMCKDEKSLLEDFRTLDKYGKKAVLNICAIEKDRVDENRTIYTSENQGAVIRYIPKYTSPTAAGASVMLAGDEFEMLKVDSSVPYDADFAVQIHGESMMPYIEDGETVYVKKDVELHTGDIGIFSVDGSMYCKQYYVDSDRNLYLLSANEKLKDTNIFVSNESTSTVKCYGRVIIDTKVKMPEYFEA